MSSWDWPLSMQTTSVMHLIVAVIVNPFLPTLIASSPGISSKNLESTVETSMMVECIVASILSHQTNGPWVLWTLIAWKNSTKKSILSHWLPKLICWARRKFLSWKRIFCEIWKETELQFIPSRMMRILSSGNKWTNWDLPSRLLYQDRINPWMWEDEKFWHDHTHGKLWNRSWDFQTGTSNC